MCVAGLETCEDLPGGRAYGPCEGEVLPEAERCETTVDDDCDGEVNDGCPCVPGAVEACFEADPTRLGVGACAAGEHECNADGLGFGACEGQVLPGAEDPTNPDDEDCDGYASSEVLWALHIKGDEQEQLGSVVSDPSTGDVFITGYSFSSVLTVGGQNLSGPGLFAIKVSPDGTVVYARVFPTTGTYRTKASAVDSQGNLVFVGDDQLGTTIDFGPISPTFAGDAFTVQLDQQGEINWVRGCTGDVDMAALAIEPATDAVLVAARARDGVDCGGASMVADSLGDVLLMRLGGSSGAALLESLKAGPGADTPYGLAAPTSTQAFLSATFAGGADLGGLAVSPGGAVVAIDSFLGATDALTEPGVSFYQLEAIPNGGVRVYAASPSNTPLGEGSFLATLDASLASVSPTLQVQLGAAAPSAVRFSTQGERLLVACNNASEMLSSQTGDVIAGAYDLATGWVYERVLNDEPYGPELVDVAAGVDGALVLGLKLRGQLTLGGQPYDAGEVYYDSLVVQLAP